MKLFGCGASFIVRVRRRKRQPNPQCRGDVTLLEWPADDPPQPTLHVGEILDFTGDVPKLKPACQIPEHARRAIASVKVKRYVEGTGDKAREVEVTEFTLWNKPAR